MPNRVMLLPAVMLAVLALVLLLGGRDESLRSTTLDGRNAAPSKPATLLSGNGAGGLAPQASRVFDSNVTAPSEAEPLVSGMSPPGTLALKFVNGGQPINRGTAILWRHVPGESNPLRRTPAFELPVGQLGVVQFRGLSHDAWTPGLRYGGDREVMFFETRVVLDHSPNRQVVIDIARNISGSWNENTSPPGTLEFQFLVGDVPLSTGVAFVQRHKRRDEASTTQVERDERIADAGVVRFEGLGADEWTPGLRIVPNGVWRFPTRAVSSANANQRGVIRLGAVSILGTVYDDNGDPLEGATVHAESIARWRATVKSDAVGQYLLPHCHTGGSLLLELTTPKPLYARRNKTKRIIVARGPQQTVDWGTPDGIPILAGQLLCIDQEPVRGPGTIVLQSTEGNEQYRLRYDEEGRFREYVEPDSYSATVREPLTGERLKTFHVQVGNRGSVERWTIEGTRLVGQVRCRGESSIPHGVDVLLDKADRQGDTVRAQTIQVLGGQFRLYGVPAGTYRVRIRLIGDVLLAETTVTIQDGDAEVRHDIEYDPEDRR